MCGGSNKTTTTSNQTYTPSPAISAAGTQALTGAQQAAQAPFQMPVAPTAQFSPFQNQAFEQIQGMQGMSLPYFQQGANMLQGSAAPITGQDVGQYYNPFAQNVTNQMQNIFGQQMRQATQGATQSAGGIGADRIAVAQSQLANQQGLAAGQTYAGMYNQALQAAQQQKQMMAGAGFGMGQLGGAAQTSYLQGTGALAQAGAQQQALDQAQQNAIYQNRLAEIAYPFQTNQYLAGITGGLAPAMGGSTSGTSTTEKPQPSPLNQILGLAGTAAGAFFGGPLGASIGGSLGSGLGGMFGGGGSASGGQPESSSPWGTTSAGGFGFNYGNRGGRVNGYASGGAAYGRLAEQRFADSPVGNPYASSISDDSDSEDSGYARGGDVNVQRPRSEMFTPSLRDVVVRHPLGDAPDEHYRDAERARYERYRYATGGSAEEEPVAMPGSKALPVTAMTTVPNIPLRMGAGHSGLISNIPSPLDLRHAPDEKPQGGGGGMNKLAGMAGKALSGKLGGGGSSDVYTPDDGPVNILEEARGGAVNPFDHYQGFEAGGDTGSEWADDVPPWASEPEEPKYKQPSSYGPVFPVTPKDYKSPFERYTEANPTSEADVPPIAKTAPSQPPSPPEPSPPPVASRLGREGIAGLAEEGPQNPFAEDERRPLPPSRPLGAPQPAGSLINRAAPVTRDMESSGRYQHVEPSYDKQGRPRAAYGAYGMMGENVRDWSKEMYGESISIREFLDNPKIQDAMYRHKMGEYIKKYGVEGAGRAWLGGEGAVRNPYAAQDKFGSTPGGYGQKFAARVGAQEGDEETGDTSTEMAAQKRTPNIVGNRDLTIDKLRMPREKMPYPDSTKRDWGQNLIRNPWSAVMVGGARMAQHVGPVGSALGAGIEAGLGHLEGQRKSLATEEGINQRAEGLYQAAQKHLDTYQRLTPYQEYMKDYHKETLERTKYQPHNIEYVDENGETVTRAVRFNPKTGVYEDPKTGEEISGKLIAKQTGAESATSRANRANSNAQKDADFYSDPIEAINKYRRSEGLPDLKRADLGRTKETAGPDPGPGKRESGKFYVLKKPDGTTYVDRWQ